MKSIIKGVLVVAAMLLIAATVGAEEVTLPLHERVEENISFNYGENTFSVSIPEEIAQGAEKELTIMLVKGNHTETSLAEIPTADICYIGQAGGLKYSDLFNNLGVKYTNGKFDTGEYTLITSGYDMNEVSRTEIFLGNAFEADGSVSEYMNSFFSDKTVTCGTMERTCRVYEEDDQDNYIYVGVGEFDVEETVATGNLGFAVQMKDGEVLKRGYRSLNDFGIKALNGITSVEGVFNIGIQINGLAKGTDIVAIPYVIAG